MSNISDLPNNEILQLMISYNKNMEHLLAIYSEPRPNRTTSSTRANPHNTQEIPVNRNSFSSIFTQIQPAETSRLTNAQIQENTKIFVYDPEIMELSDSICSISHSEFRKNDILCEINSCKHVFKNCEIQKWFDVNSTCPVCRSNIVAAASTTATRISARQSEDFLNEFMQIINSAMV